MRPLLQYTTERLNPLEDRPKVFVALDSPDSIDDDLRPSPFVLPRETALPSLVCEVRASLCHRCVLIM